MDGNSERRALRKRIMALHGVEVVGACDLTEAASICHRDRYDAVLIDIRRDHHGRIAWRDEIKKEKPQQIVAFLVGKPEYIEPHPLAGSYVAEEQGAQWGDSLRKAIRESYASLPQRQGFVEAGWRIATAKKLDGTTFRTSELPGPTKRSQQAPGDAADSRDLTTAVAEIEQESQFCFGTNVPWNQHGTGPANENDNRVSTESPRQRRA
jgi:hypothetical protein